MNLSSSTQFPSAFFNGLQIQKTFEIEECVYKKSWLFLNDKKSLSPLHSVQIINTFINEMVIKIFFKSDSCDRIKLKYNKYYPAFIHDHSNGICNFEFTSSSSFENLQEILSSLVKENQFSDAARKKINKIADKFPTKNENICTQESSLEKVADAKIEILELDVISFDSFTNRDPAALNLLRKGLLEKGIVGIKSIPGYKENAQRLIDKLREFSLLPEVVKESYIPNREIGEWLGYEVGKEQFQRPDGTWVPDDSKVSYYALTPDSKDNKWPAECDIKTPFYDISTMMLEMGKKVMEAIDLIGPNSIISSEGITAVGRMLHYVKQSDETMDNPFWCGAHFDHGMFTALLPGFYFANGQPIPEPVDAGLFVRVAGDTFYKVVADDPDVMLFQVGEFGQLASHDAIKATEHRVQKARGEVERYTMAMFMMPPMETIIYSNSDLVKDARYGMEPDGSCSYKQWHVESLKRYEVKK